MSLRILIIDNDEDWLCLAEEFLSANNYEAYTASTGKSAQLEIYNSEKKFFSIILNLNVKNHSGLQVLSFIKANYPAQNIIIILEQEPDASNSEALTIPKLKKMGASDVLIKPFELDDIRTTLEGNQSVGHLFSQLSKKEGLSEEEEVEGNDEDYVKIKVEDFYSSNNVLFDVFIRLSQSKYVKILHAGEALSKERVTKYKTQKQIDFFYFHKKDRAKFLKFNNYLAKKMINNEKVPSTQKVSMLRKVSEKFLEQAFDDGVKPMLVEQGKEICKNVYNLIESQKDLYKMLRSYQDFDPNAFSHGYLVTLFSSMIIKNFDWQSESTIKSTAMASMFHDIGKMALDPKFLTLKKSEMTPEDLIIYKTHSDKGYEILDKNRLINSSIKQIVIQHHESFDGTGFPYGKKGSKILTLSNIVSLSDYFANIIVENNATPIEALKILLKGRDKLTAFNSKIVENLIKVFADPKNLKKL